VVYLVAVLVVGGLLFLRLLRKKNRIIWDELFKQRAESQSVRSEIVELRKQIVISGVGDSTRLPLLMPSQYGEDVLLWKFFKNKRDGFYIDVGAYDGVGFSNTYFFEAIGWNGILIEPVPQFYESCLAARPHSRVINAVVSDGKKRATEFSIAEGDNGVGTLSFAGEDKRQVGRIEKEGGRVRTTRLPSCSLNEVLTSHQGTIDFLSIDVEGKEMDVLRGFDLNKFRPRVVIVEDNSNGVDKQVGDWFSAYDYQERFRCEHNVFYTHKDEPGIFHW
jgi:methyltransferase, FkbM family